MIEKNKIKSDYIFWIIVGIITSVFAIKALIVTHISLTDESYYIATALRFAQGDSPLVDDWNPGQLQGVVLLPFVCTYVALKGSTEGIVLCLRFVYMLLKLFILIYGYFRLHNEKNKIGIFAGMLLWYCFSPGNIDTLSYWAAPLCFLMFGVIVLHSKASEIEYCLMGFFYALSILSQPFWVISYIFILGYILLTWRKEIIDRKRNYR